MKKLTQSILLTLVFSVAVAARLSILGWLGLIGLGSVLIFGVGHLIIHFSSMNYLTLKGRGNSIKIILSHVLLLCIFLFQIDADSKNSFSVIGYIIGGENNSLNNIGFQIVAIAAIAYVVLSGKIITETKKEKIKENNTRFIIPSVLVSLILTPLFINALFTNQDIQREKGEEGRFESIKNRALNNPDSVETLDVISFQSKLTEFPDYIFELHNVKEIDLLENNISRIPSNISQLKKLETLNLIDNNIQEIPSSICECEKLKELRIGGNIKAFPECLKKMKSLKHLTIQSNTVNELMDELVEFENIETFHFYLKEGIIDHNKLDRIRKEMGLKHSY